MSEWIEVAPCEELRDGAIYKVEHGDRVVAVVKLDEEYYALDGVCGHAGGPLCSGEVDREGKILACPWHGWEYDITTGQCLFDDSLKQKMYPLEVRDGHVFVDID